MQVNVLATMLFALTVIAIGLVLWQQRRAERLAAIAPRGSRRDIRHGRGWHRVRPVVD